MVKVLRCLMLIVLFVTILIGCGQSDDIAVIDEARQKEMDSFLEKADSFLSNRDFNGSVLVAKDGIVYLAEGYGIANENSGEPNERGTKYNIASITKSFTSMAIMQLQEANKLSVDDPIDKYFPNYFNDSEITIHHLLTHTSGIPHNPIEGTEFKNLIDLHNGVINKNLISEVVEMAANLPLRFEPGTQFDYSDNGYFLLGAIIEEVSGLSYGEYIDEFICKPLEMNNTGFNSTTVPLEGQAVDFSKNYSSNVPPSYTYSGGGIHSNVDDLFKWNQAIRNNSLIDKKSTEAMLTPFLGSYAYGWIVRNGEGFMHTGKLNGFRALFLANIESDYTIIILSNYPSTGEVSRIEAVLTSFIEDLN